GRAGRRNGHRADAVFEADGTVGRSHRGAGATESGTGRRSSIVDRQSSIVDDGRWPNADGRSTTMTQYLAIVPVVCVWLGGAAAMLAEAFRRPGERMPIGGLGVIGLTASLVAALLLWDRGAQSFGVVSADNFGLFVSLVLAVVGILTIALSHQIVDRDGIPAGEYYALLLFAIGGMMLMAMGSDLLIIFIALEILSLAIYILTAIRREVKAGAEAAFKYFLLGGFSSAFFLYGIAFTFGVAGSTRLDHIVVVMSGRVAGQQVLSYLALGLLLVGFAFKVSAVPFHMWT